MGFSEICNGHKNCPYCGSGAPVTTNDAAVGCCSDGIEYGFWEPLEDDERKDNGAVLFWHSNDECAKGDE